MAFCNHNISIPFFNLYIVLLNYIYPWSLNLMIVNPMTTDACEIIAFSSNLLARK